MRAKFIDVGGINTRVLYEGDAKNPAIFLIHGFGIGAESWIMNIDALAKDFFVVAPDLIGHGFTDPIDLKGEPPHSSHIKHLFGVADAFGLKQFYPSGSSYGALMSALLWFEQPKRVPKLILNGTGSCFNTEAELSAALQGTLKNASMAILSPTLESCRRRMGNTVYDIQMVPDTLLLSQLTAYARPDYAVYWRQSMEGMMNMEKSRKYRILERLEKLDVDTLIVWGREDPRGVYARAVEACKRMPRAKLVTFEKCGHLPYLEYPELFHTAVKDFLRN